MNEVIVKYIQPSNPYKRAKWELVEDYTSYTGVLVPKGYVTDGASVPVFLHTLMSPTGPIFKAAIVHDYLIDKNNGNWDEANRVFYEELEYCDISDFRIRVIKLAINTASKFRSKRVIL